MRPLRRHGRFAVAALGGAALVVAAGWWSRPPGADAAPAPVAQAPPERAWPSSAPEARVAVSPGPAPVAPSFELLEVGTHRAGGREVAVLKVDGGSPRAYAVGDSLRRGARLRRIMPGAVELEQSSGVLTLALATPVAGRVRTLGPLPSMKHGAQAASDPVPEPQAVGGFGQDRPRSSATDRAIHRAITGPPSP